MLLSIYHILYVVAALVKINTKLLYISEHQLPVREKLLILHEVSNPIITHLLVCRALREDSKCIVMLLTVEENV